MSDATRPTYPPAGQVPTPATQPATPLEPPPAMPPSTPPPPATGPTPGTPSHRLRWLVAISGAVLVVAAIAAILWLTRQGTTETSGAPRYLPADTFAYSEVRLDLPGDQRENVGRFLSRFPGFADTANLQAKLDDVLDRLVRLGSGGRSAYTSDIKPWFAGQLAVGMAGPTGSAGEAPAAMPLFVVSVADRAKAEVALEKFRADSAREGLAWTSQAAHGTTIWSARIAEPQAPGGRGISDVVLALTDEALLISGRTDTVSEALARRASGESALARKPGFGEALAKLRRDRLATLYLDTARLRSLAEQQLAGRDGGTSQAVKDALARIPDSVFGELHFEADRLVVEARLVLPAGTERPSGRASVLLPDAPAGAFAYGETRDVGPMLARFVESWKKDPALGEAAETIRQIEGLIGARLESFVDWIGDVAIVVGGAQVEPTGVLMATTRDEEGGKARLRQVGALLSFLGAGTGPAVRETDHAGTTITTISLPLRALGPNVPSLPGGASLPETISVSYAFRSGRFYAGPGESAVRWALDTAPGTGLGSDPRLKGVVGTQGAERSVAIGWLDVATLRTTIEAFLQGPRREEYLREVRPYLEPLDQLVSVTSIEGDTLITRTYISVK
ncbi:MAG TPA: DUF3352 domain-containing protein [Candidatus Limnocylindrales bacterium]|nr:DUF3352 domain-containing protein [Candidatus Limnocylindrales bacterium]